MYADFTLLHLKIICWRGWYNGINAVWQEVVPLGVL